jgi:hypothetical protein
LFCPVEVAAGVRLTLALRKCACARKPSHLTSYTHPAPAGSASASVGSSSGI